MTTPINTLLPLVTGLKACPARDTRFSQRKLVEAWERFRQLSPEQEDEIAPAVMAGLVLHDGEQFATLLNEAERSQLAALARTALERFQEKTNPPNKLGKLIAASLKETK